MSRENFEIINLEKLALKRNTYKIIIKPPKNEFIEYFL